jgi:hypothetical protein
MRPPAAHRLGRQDAEQAEVRRLVLEEADNQPRVVGPAEHLEAAIGLDQAHGSDTVIGTGGRAVGLGFDLVLHSGKQNDYLIQDADKMAPGTSPSTT